MDWKTEKRKLGDLIPRERNPAKISDHDKEHLGKSLERFGVVIPFVVQPDGGLIDGHQRKLALSLSQEYGPETVVDVRVPSRRLTDGEVDELAVRLRRNVGEFDWDILKEDFDKETLAEWGFTEEDFEEAGFGFEGDENYTRKIVTPEYEPSDVMPGLGELFDTTKTDALMEEINASDLPDDEKQFLRIAARRHTTLNFSKVADYYAHAEAEMQLLMENSALVIIDIDRAIALGFVNLSKNIAEMVGDEYGDEE